MLQLIWERYLPQETVTFVERFCDTCKVPLLAYCGEDIYRRQQCSVTDEIVTYDDPMPILFPGGLSMLHESGIKVHKMILMADDSILADIRESLAAGLHGIGGLTQAVPGLLEVLPWGSSKGDGVLRLLDAIDVSTKHTCAFGDGENDIEMFQAVEYSVAVANAKPKLKCVAKFVTESNENSGVAKALFKIIDVSTTQKVSRSIQRGTTY
jgi:hydroxymethylpyrimidine pyrophosphatase-like HAD family hydrolase